MSKNYLYPCGLSADTAGRRLDAAGKLVTQPARPDLKKTGYVDLNRRPGFVKQ